MPIRNQEIAAAFSELADLLEIEGSNPFRIRAYRNAARMVESTGQEMASLVEQGKDLTELDGIGKDLAAKIETLLGTGKLEALEELRASMPRDITAMLRLPGLGPKRVATLYHELGVKTLDELAAAAREGKVRELPGLGEKSEQQLLKALEKQANQETRFLRADTIPYVQHLVADLEALKAAEAVEVAGSFRRGRETVGDIDLLVRTKKPVEVMKTFVEHEDVDDVLAHGEKKSSVRLRTGLQVDLRAVPAESMGAALHYFTGSKAHNIAVRKRAQERGLKVNEYGVMKGEEQVAGRTEQEVFSAVGLAYIEPELREGRGELAAAEEHTLPALLEPQHVRGDLHMHTTASDGKNSIREMAEAARERGYQYIAITDHSKRLTVANGLDEKRLRKQLEEVDRVNDDLDDIEILKGIEVDILEDGALDLSDDVLGELDVVIGSVHSKFNLSREQQTERVMRAMDHPYFTFVGHPTGRLLLARDPYDVDVERLIEHAAGRGCFLELNANPQRLDLHEVHGRMAKEAGVLVVVNTDAHRTTDLDLMTHGVTQARRGWLEKKDVLNTRTLKQLLPLLKGTFLE